MNARSRRRKGFCPRSFAEQVRSDPDRTGQHDGRWEPFAFTVRNGFRGRDAYPPPSLRACSRQCSLIPDGLGDSHRGYLGTMTATHGKRERKQSRESPVSWMRYAQSDGRRAHRGVSSKCVCRVGGAEARKGMQSGVHVGQTDLDRASSKQSGGRRWRRTAAGKTRKADLFASTLIGLHTLCAIRSQR